MVGKQKRVGVYLRVSKDDQTSDNQRLELERVAEQRNWNIVEIYLDHAVSGRKDKRPALARMVEDAHQGKLDVVAAWHIDRLGRSQAHCINLLADLTERHVAVYLHQQQVDGTTTAGKAMLGMCAVFAEFEWNTISDRIKSGLDRARKQGKRIGRPTTVTAATEAQIRKLHGDPKKPSMGKLKIAKQLGIGVSTVQRVLGSAASS
jgi:DNA invertase Pin-like site-specific DNA recombinase